MATLRERYAGLPSSWRWRNPEEHLRKVSEKVNGLLQGEANNGFVVALEAGATYTDIDDARLDTLRIPLLVPMSASAAATMGSLWVEPKNGSLRLHHSSSSATDRTVGVVFFG
jgi:hypothetical protein